MRATLQQHPAPETDTFKIKNQCSSLVTLQGSATPVGCGRELHGLSLHREQGTASDKLREGNVRRPAIAIPTLS